MTIYSLRDDYIKWGRIEGSWWATAKLPENEQFSYKACNKVLLGLTLIYFNH